MNLELGFCSGELCLDRGLDSEPGEGTLGTCSVFPDGENWIHWVLH